MGLINKELLIELFNRYQGKIFEKKGVKNIMERLNITPERVKMIVNNSLDTPQNALEKIRGTNNLTSVSFLLRGYEVSQGVGLVVDLSKDFDNAPEGTGFMVAPNIFITNNHVLDEQKLLSGNFGIRMNYQRDLESNIDPYFEYRITQNKAKFHTDQYLDFTIVEIESMDTKNQVPLSDFGYLKLFEQKGKIVLNEFCTLIQHPDGKPKQTALFENEIVYIEDNKDFILYSTDSSHGSSGSPVFNYEWVVVALHHAGVPTSLDGINQGIDSFIDSNDYPQEANEGIRISSIMNNLKQNNVDLYDIITKAAHAPLEESIPQNPFRYARYKYMNETSLEANNPKPIQSNKKSNNPQITTKMNQDSNVLRINIPLEIRIGTNSIIISSENEEAEETDLERRKKKKKKPAYEDEGEFSNISSRSGYDSAFLNGLPISLSDLYKPFIDKGLVAPTLDGKSELDYTHFSVAMHKKRRMAIITAVNIDGAKSIPVPRGSDKWVLDSRMEASFQLGNTIYVNNDLDRGHMVRREDPNWGAEASQANIDTFHYTNSCPQHADLNQKEWLKLEDYVLQSTRTHDLKVSVFTGPILDENYVHYREALVPAQFYKIVAMIKTDNTPSVTGYVLTQRELISGLERVRSDFEFGKFKTYQLPLAKIEALTGLNLSSLKAYDPMNKPDEDLESIIQIKEINGLADLKL